MKRTVLAWVLLAVLLLTCVGCGASADPETAAAKPSPVAEEQTPIETPEPTPEPTVSKDDWVELKAGAGVGTIDFDPSIFPTEGFSGVINDSPHVRILLLEAGQRAAIVACELVNTPATVIEAIRAKIAERAEVPEENIWVHSTHAITTPHEPGDEAVLAAADAALEQALASFAPATLGVGTAECDVNVNRNIETPEGIVGGPYYGRGGTGYSNKTMTLLRFDGEDGTPIAFFLSYGIKPTALDNSEMDAGTRVISSDVPGKACTMVEETFGAPCLFCMPAAGDQYPREMTMFYDLNEEGTHMVEHDLGVEAGLEIMNRLGDEMGTVAVELAGSIECGEDRSFVAGASDNFTASERRMAQVSEVMVDVSVLALGDVAFVGFKQELDAATEQEIQEASGFEHTLLISFLNGDGKYMPHDAAYDLNSGKGSYEVLKSGFERGTAECLVSLADELLQGLR